MYEFRYNYPKRQIESAEEETYMDFHKECLYDVGWQRLRVSLLGRNNDYGGFGTSDGVNINLMKLEEYIEAADKNSVEFPIRAWRVSNLLAATMLGYGDRAEYSHLKGRLTIAHRTYSGYHLSRKATAQLRAAANIGWDWKRVEQDLQVLVEEDFMTFQQIYVDLIKRKKTAKRKLDAGDIKQIVRPELDKFVALMEATSLQVLGV